MGVPDKQRWYKSEHFKRWFKDKGYNDIKDFFREKIMPSSKNYVRNYDQEQKTAKKRGEYPDTLARNRNRKQAIKDGKVSRGDGKDLAHVKAKSKGGSDDKGNLRVQDDGANRSFPRTSSGAMKGRS